MTVIFHSHFLYKFPGMSFFFMITTSTNRNSWNFNELRCWMPPMLRGNKSPETENVVTLLLPKHFSTARPRLVTWSQIVAYILLPNWYVIIQLLYSEQNSIQRRKSIQNLN